MRSSSIGSISFAAALAAVLQFACSSADLPNSRPLAKVVAKNAPHVMPPIAQDGSAGSTPRAHPDVSTAADVTYQGGTGGIGVETSPKLYLVFWGSQWSSDPSGEAAILQSFYAGLGGSTWNGIVTQYCQGVAVGTVSCNGAGQSAGNPAGIYAGAWFDNGAAAPSSPTQTDLANEAVAAASHFGNTTAASNASTQYVIATAHGNNQAGLGSSFCAWHSSVASGFGNIAYTNLPYVTDAGANCGANFNGLGANAGITIVAGHEFAETESDQFPPTGWMDGVGAEIGDKCAWISSGQGAVQNVAFSTGTFPMQSLWSNIPGGGAGACVFSLSTTTICTPGDDELCCPSTCTRGCSCGGDMICNSTGTAWSRCTGATCAPNACL